jgi:TRAP-type C4-dicarboxylate transport system permease small subunit
MHYGVTVFVSLIPRRGQRFVQTLVDLVLTVSLIYVTYLCWNLTASVTTRVTPFLHLSYKWIYMPTVIGMGLMGVHSIRFFIDDVMKLAGRREEAEKMFDDEVNYEGEKFL